MRRTFGPMMAIAFWASPILAAQEERIVVYGDGFVLSVRPPTGWLGATVLPDGSEKDGQHDMVCYRDGRVPVDRITIYVDRKPASDAECLVEADGVTWEKLSYTHPRYETDSQLLHLNSHLRLYASTVDPDAKAGFTVTVAMLVGGPATPEDMQDFANVMRSISFRSVPGLKDDERLPPPPDLPEPLPRVTPRSAKPRGSGR